MDFVDENIYALVDAIDASIYWKDVEGRYLACNKYMLKMAGIAHRSDIVGKKDKDLPWCDIANALAANDKIVLGGVYYEGYESPITSLGSRVFHTKKLYYSIIKPQ